MKTFLLCLISAVFLCQMVSGQNAIAENYRECAEDLSLTLESLSESLEAEIQIKTDSIRRLDGRCVGMSFIDRIRCHGEVSPEISVIRSDIRDLKFEFIQIKTQALRDFYNCKASGQAVPAVQEVSAFPVVQEVSASPVVSEVSDVSKVSDVSEVPEVSKVSEVSKASDVSEVSEASAYPLVSEVSDDSDSAAIDNITATVTEEEEFEMSSEE